MVLGFLGVFVRFSSTVEEVKTEQCTIRDLPAFKINKSVTG